MSYESTAEPIKVGYLMDFKLPPGFPEELFASFTQTFDLIFEEAVQQGLMDRPVQMIYREVEGLPKGSVKAVIDAYGELVDEGCLVVFGPNITDNCVPMKEAIEERLKVPAISVCGTDDWLGEWTFSFPQGSMTDEPIFLADLIGKKGITEIGVLMEQSLIGQSYLKNLRTACQRKGIRIVAEVAVAQTAQDINEAVRTLHDAKAEAIVHLGFGFAIVFINPGVEERVGEPDHVERVHGLDGRRPVRRGEQDRAGLPRRLREEVRRQPPRVLRDGGQPRRRRDIGAGVRRCPPAQPARRQGSAGAGQDDARRVRRSRHPGVVRQVDSPRLDGRRISGRPHAGRRRRQLAPRRPLRGRRVRNT